MKTNFLTHPDRPKIGEKRCMGFLIGPICEVKKVESIERQDGIMCYTETGKEYLSEEVTKGEYDEVMISPILGNSNAFWLIWANRVEKFMGVDVFLEKLYSLKEERGSEKTDSIKHSYELLKIGSDEKIWDEILEKIDTDKSGVAPLLTFMMILKPYYKKIKNYQLFFDKAWNTALKIEGVTETDVVNLFGNWRINKLQD